MQKDEWLVSVLKLALDYNAAIIAQASLIAGTQLSERDGIRFRKWFMDTEKEYSEQLTKLANPLKADTLTPNKKETT